MLGIKVGRHDFMLVIHASRGISPGDDVFTDARHCIRLMAMPAGHRPTPRINLFFMITRPPRNAYIADMAMNNVFTRLPREHQSGPARALQEISFHGETPGAILSITNRDYEYFDKVARRAKAAPSQIAHERGTRILRSRCPARNRTFRYDAE